MNRFFRHIVFDLDDTLLDTSGSLIPAAARRAIEAMLTVSGQREETGRAPVDVDSWLAKRNEILRRDPRADVWLRLDGDEEIADIGRRAFFTYPVELMPDAALRLTDGATEILNWSRERATLHLVTSGDATTQNKKIERLGIASFFNSIQIVDATYSPAGPLRKRAAFQKIADSNPGAVASEMISIGNRVDTDLGAAKIIGWKTVWIRYGEHANLSPQRPEEIPDFEVPTLKDLLSIWWQQFKLDDQWNV